jgi:hypothetical protein
MEGVDHKGLWPNRKKEGVEEMQSFWPLDNNLSGQTLKN